MIALFFEVLPRPGQDAAYLDMAAKLKPALDHNGGLLFLDRSRSSSRRGWYLSHQFWQDEASMVRWRENPAHHRAQVCGRTDILADYRLRVAQVIAGTDGDYEPGQTPSPPSSGSPARWIISSVSRAPTPAEMGEAFTSVYDPALTVSVMPLTSAAEGYGVLDALQGRHGLLHARLCRIIRDYGMFDRTQAPQHFDPLTLA